MTALIALLLLAMSGITFTAAQVGTVPREICRVVEFKIFHLFLNDPNIDKSNLTQNTETIKRLREFILSVPRCSIVTDTEVHEIKHEKDDTLPQYTEIIDLKVSANSNFTNPNEGVANLTFCLDAVAATIGNQPFIRSLMLNVSGKLNGKADGVSATGQQKKSCCHVIYGKDEDVNLCCKPGFIEDGTKCACGKGKFLNRGSCDVCQEDTYQPNEGSISCLTCPNGTTTHGTTGVNSLDSCKPACLPGQSYNSTSQNCTACPKNTYQPLAGKTMCISCQNDTITKNIGNTNREDCVRSCPKGSFYSFTSNSCELCPQNSFQSEEGQFTCTQCKISEITISDGAKLKEDCIKNCLQGSFFDKSANECKGCPLDTYQPMPGTIECIRCPAGEITTNRSSKMREDCIKNCSAGSFFNLTTNKCESCPLNSYQPKSGQTACITCQVGRITVDVSAASEQDCIKECDPGFFYNSNGFISDCYPCPQNTYKPTKGPTECMKCPNGTKTYKDQPKINITDCKEECNRGFYFNVTTWRCVPCPQNTTQENKGQTTCNACPSDRPFTEKEATVNQADCTVVCQPGEYYDNTTENCNPCPLNTYQPAQRQFHCIKCPVGRLTKSVKSTSFSDCLRDCSKGFFHNMTSKSCTKCPIGKYKNRSGYDECMDCGAGYSTLAKGSVNDTQCILECFPGNYYNFTLKRCLNCPLNTYQDRNVATKCLFCPSQRTTVREGAKSEVECDEKAEPRGRSEENLKLIVTIPVVLTVLVVSGCLLVLCFYRKWQKKEKERQRMSGRPLDPHGRRSKDYESGMGERLDSVASMANHHYKMQGTGLKPENAHERPTIRIANIPKELEIPRDNLKFLGQVLGKGNFGKVEKALLLKDDRTEHVVAVKMIKGGGTFSDEKELFDELEMLASLYPHPHPNIVNLIGGSTTNDGPLFVVVEYCGEGNLLKYLQKHQIQMRSKQEYVNIPPKAAKPGIPYQWKLQKALEICNGMAHLAKFKIIHRDVAARNVLLDQNWVAKISDFGMARDIYVKQIYRKDTEGFLPVRWMAIESLESFIYTTQSDVWSFGILLWEIISDGRVPYNNIFDHTQLLNYIKSGRVMKRPKGCPKDLYHIMEKCWSTNPSDRPSFASLKDALEFLYENEVHKDDALPQRILRKFSSRRRKRQSDDDGGGGENPRRKLPVQKTFSNSSTLRISKIEEEGPKPKKDNMPEEQGIRLEVLDPAKESRTVAKEFENEGYEKSGGSTSEDHDGPESSQKAYDKDNLGLDTISETPSSRENEQKEDSNLDNTKETKEGRTLPNEVEDSFSLQQLIENELKAPIESAENHTSPSQESSVTGDDSKHLRKSSTFC